jgi:maleate isomerase
MTGQVIAERMARGATAESVRPELVEHIPFKTDAGIASRARLGLIVLATDYTIEAEWRSVMACLPGVALYQSRILNSATITPETLAAMKDGITSATAVILPGDKLDVVAFGCTSAAMVLGEEVVFAKIREARPDVKATTPITAAFAAFQAFGAKRIGVLTPYRYDVNEVVRSYIERAGFEVPVFGSFNEENDGVVAKIAPESIERGIEEITRRRAVDMVFVSCTSVRLMQAAANIERTLSLPVTSSNHAMMWHSLRLAGVEDRLPQFGRLFQR